MNDVVLEGDKIGEFLDEKYASKRIEHFCPHTLVTKEGKSLSNLTILAHGRSVSISSKTGKVSRVSLKARDWDGNTIMLVWQEQGVVASSIGVPVTRVQKIIKAQ